MVYNNNSMNKAFICLCWLDLAIKIAGVILTATPSNTVEVNQTVTLQCVLDPNPTSPVIVSFSSGPTYTLCTLEPNNGKCKNASDPCTTLYNASCPNETVYSVQVNVPLTWNGISLFCQSLYSGKSNMITFYVTVPVISVTLTPTSIKVTEEQQLNLTCETSYCFPSANITWYKSLVDITSQSTSIRNESNGLKKTTSFMRSKVNRMDDGKEVYCTAINTPPRTVQSDVIKLIVHYKPDVASNTSNPYKPIEGQTATLKCEVTAANPNTGITWKWFKNESRENILYGGPNYAISNIYRNMSGSYSCIAINSVGPSEAIITKVDVQYKPDVASNTSNPYKPIEGRTATLKCEVTAANPSTGITWKWFKTESEENILHRGPNYAISNIYRNMSGSYNCIAINSVGPSEATITNVDVQYPPSVHTLYKKDIIEGEDLEVTCQTKPGNPSPTTFFWSKVNDALFGEKNGDTLQLFAIQRNSSGYYKCTAENNYGNGEKGSDSQTMFINVLYKPTILEKTSTRVHEGDQVILTREVISNPLANVSWYNGSELLKTQSGTNNASFIIKEALCTDTKNYTIFASNEVEQNVAALVELLVYCKPRSFDKNITIGVTDRTGIEFSTIVIAYPEPCYELQYDNGTTIDKITDSITKNYAYNFTIRFNQTSVTKDDYGTYHLKVNNSFGETIIYVNVVPQRKPSMPKVIELVCDVRRATVRWISSFNGGDPQSFIVFALNGQNKESKSNMVSDNGENKIHSTYLYNLRPSTAYVFYVSASNKHGFSPSENISCMTLEVPSDSLPVIAGGAVAAGITLAVIVIGVVLLLRRYTRHGKQARKSQRLENEKDSAKYEDTSEDGLKENILYVTAGPRDSAKPETAVYAAVTRKELGSNNNANVYAEVNKGGVQGRDEGALYSDVKPKKGLLKKEEKPKKKDKPKQSKGKKQKSKKEDSDVYENSDDIAMTENADNVYSNTEHNNQHDKEQRGYKNKDGLLYVEVQFEAKAKKEKEIIHGEDEKTDYATVEFPVPSSSVDGEKCTKDNYS